MYNAAFCCKGCNKLAVNGGAQHRSYTAHLTAFDCSNILLGSPRYFDLEKYFTPGKSLKSASNVQIVASNCFAVAKIMLSAKGNL